MARKDYIFEKMKAHQQIKLGGFFSSFYLMGLFVIESGELSKKAIFLLLGVIIFFFMFSIWQWYKQLKLSKELELL